MAIRAAMVVKTAVLMQVKSEQASLWVIVKLSSY